VNAEEKENNVKLCFICVNVYIVE